MESELKAFSHRRETSGPYADHLELDALVIGAGFSGVYMLHELRKLGLKTVIYDAGKDLGGTWRFNCYPGAGVDSEVPEYQFSIPETYRDWNWSTNYPNYEELRAYFDHVDKVLGIKKDCAFETVVVDAKFDTDKGHWKVTTADGRIVQTKYLVAATGFAAKRYIPDFPGIDKFKGIIHHSSFWPQEGVDVKGKRCAVIGTGASGVQVTQAWGPIAGDLKVFQRTPNLAIPMRKRPLTVEEQNIAKKSYPELFSLREKCFAGMLYTFSERTTFEDNEEEREAFLENLWQQGGFRYWVGNYKDYLFDAKANREVYNFWAKKVRERIGDPKARDLLAPLEGPHPFGVKRPCLEYDYYEQFNRPTVDLINIKDNPISEFTETGIKLVDGTTYEFDVICVATGFDVSTGSLTQMGLRSIHGKLLEDEWKKAAYTYLGTTISGYPNLFHMYGPQAPTLFSNGPTAVEIQGRWIVDVIKQAERRGIKYIDPTQESSLAWKDIINHFSNISLFPTTKSTYMGGNVPGKAFEMHAYAGGIPAFAAEVRKTLPEFNGFTVVKA